MSKESITTEKPPIREFKVLCFYHTKETGETKVLARTAEDAEEIVRMHFKKNYTDKCILDKVEVIV